MKIIQMLICLFLGVIAGVVWNDSCANASTCQCLKNDPSFIGFYIPDAENEEDCNNKCCSKNNTFVRSLYDDKLTMNCPVKYTLESFKPLNCKPSDSDSSDEEKRSDDFFILNFNCIESSESDGYSKK